MPSPSYTYTLTNGTVADASQVMQNFTDILNGVTDGTKDLSVAALTAAGTATLNGNINLGNSSADDLTITASLASTLPIKTTNSFNIGSATLGLAGIYFGTGDTDTARIVSASLAASRTYTLPDAGGAADFVMNAGAQTVAGAKSFSSQVVETSGNGFKVDATVDTTIQTDSSNAYHDSTTTLLFRTNGTTTALTLSAAQIATFVSTIRTPVAASGGNESSPIITASDDTNTGIYYSADVFGISAGGNSGLEVRSGGVIINKTGSSPAGVIDIYGDTNTPTANEIFTWRQANGTVHIYNGNSNGASTGENAAAAILKVRQDSSSSRSINAAGTVNVAGLDYAEYMLKANTEDIIAKGEVCGITSEGKLTKKWSESHSFVIKSTNPSYVGGDTWFNTHEDFEYPQKPRKVNVPVAPGSKPEFPNDPEPYFEGDPENQLAAELREFLIKEWKKRQSQRDAILAEYSLIVRDYEAACAQYVLDQEDYNRKYEKFLKDNEKFNSDIEVERIKWDRVAFCGQVPCIITNTYEPGDWILPQDGPNDSIIAYAVPDKDLSFSQYKTAIARVWSRGPQGKAMVVVGLR